MWIFNIRTYHILSFSSLQNILFSVYSLCFPLMFTLFSLCLFWLYQQFSPCNS